MKNGYCILILILMETIKKKQIQWIIVNVSPFKPYLRLLRTNSFPQFYLQLILRSSLNSYYSTDNQGKIFTNYPGKIDTSFVYYFFKRNFVVILLFERFRKCPWYWRRERKQYTTKNVGGSNNDNAFIRSTNQNVM